MKRYTAAAAALVILIISCLTCTAAEKDFYCEYVKKTATGTVYYIDIYCDRKISGAVFELDYDSAKTEYKSVDTISSTSSCRKSVSDGKLKVALVDSGVISSKICRISFKALQTGKLTFSLRMIQATDENVKLIDGWNEDTLTITLGKDDIPSSGGSSGNKKSDALNSKSSGSSSHSSGSGGKSYLNENGEDGDNGDEEAADGDGGFFDLRKSSPWGYIAFGAGLVLLIAGLIFLGMMIGKRYANKKAAEKKEDLPENTEEEKAADEAPSDTSEETSAKDETE